VCLSALPAAALAELALELELSVSGAVAPARTRDRMDFEPKSELLALLSGVRATPLKETKVLSEEHQAMLLVVIGYRRKAGVSKSRVGRYWGWRLLQSWTIS
jgi:hypothetical protein